MTNNMEQFTEGEKLLIRSSDIAGKNRQAFEHASMSEPRHLSVFPSHIIWYNNSYVLSL